MVKRIVIKAKTQDSYFFLWVKCTPFLHESKKNIFWGAKNKDWHERKGTRETDRKTAPRERWLDLFTVLTKYPFPSCITTKLTNSIWFIAVFAVYLTLLWTVLSIPIERTSWNDKNTELDKCYVFLKQKKKIRLGIFECFKKNNKLKDPSYTCICSCIEQNTNQKIECALLAKNSNRINLLRY